MIHPDVLHRHKTATFSTKSIKHSTTQHALKNNFTITKKGVVMLQQCEHEQPYTFIPIPIEAQTKFISFIHSSSQSTFCTYSYNAAAFITTTATTFATASFVYAYRYSFYVGAGNSNGK